MEYRLAVIVSSFLFLVVDLMIVMNSTRHRSDSYHQKIFQMFSISVVLQQTFAMLSLIAYPAVWKAPAFLQYVFYTGLFCSMALSSMFWYLYLRALIAGGKRLSSVRKAMLPVPVGILTIACLVSPITRWVFYIDADGAYRRGSLVVLQIAAPYFYAVLAILRGLRSGINGDNARTSKMIRYFLIFLIPSVFCVIIQMFIVPGGFTAIGISMGSLLMYLELYVEETQENLRLKTVDILNQKLAETNTEQEAQLEEIRALNARLEDAAAEQESQLVEIQELNDQLKTNLEKVNIFAALSYEFAAVQVADLDAETITTIRQSSGMVRENYLTETTPYWETVISMTECFVLPEIRDDFLQFLAPEAMRRRMEQEEVFTYRYAVIPDESGDYVYEMTFVNIGENMDRHLMVLGTRCIDKLLQFEREEGQYNTALLNECEFFFGFDVTSGMITEDFIARSKYDLLQELGIRFPVSYDDFWNMRIEKQALKARTEKEASYWTAAGLRHAFEKGKTTVSLRYDSDTVGRVWEATIILTQDMTSRRLHAVYICKDVTEMMKADLAVNQALEKAKAEAEAANSAKTSFLFNMSHDIRTPMNAIMGFRDLLEKHQEDPERRADYLKKIEESSNVLLSIINNVLEMARIEKGTIELDESAWSAEQFNDTLYSIFQEMMTQKGITFTRRVDVQHPYVYCDPIKLREVFLNILSNAYKYTNAGGSVTMHLEEIPSDREGCAMYRTTITDTGIGMSAEFLPRIFEEFSREKSSTDARIEGTGLGMPIVKRLVDLMGGTIEVTSEKGAGSTFIVTIPHRLAERASLAQHAGAAIDPKLFAGKRILLAEDNELNAEIAQEILGEAGFLIERAEDGLLCCEMLSSAADGYYDLILMDIQMPNRNGYEAARAIRRMAEPAKANIPILAMTANAFEEDKREALRSGMNGHLAKPINVPELLKALAEILG